MWLHLNIDITRHIMHHLYTFVSVQKPARHSHCPSCGQRGCRRRCGHTCQILLQITDHVTRWLHHSKRNYLHLESEFAAWSPTENLHVIRSARTFHQDDIKLQFVDMSHQPNVTFLHSQFSSPYVGNFLWHRQKHQGCRVIPQNEVLQQEAREFHHHSNKKYVILTRKDNGPENGMKCT